MSKSRNYPDDLFKDTRMPFGDHLEELRYRLIQALKALVLCLVIGFVLDGIGSTMKWKWFGLGKPVLELIKQPVESEMDRFYDERAWRAKEEELDKLEMAETDEQQKKREELKDKFLADCVSMRKSSSIQLNEAQPLRVDVDREELQRAVAAAEGKDVTLTLKVKPIDLAEKLRIANERIGKRNQLTTLSAQEMFVVYFKVTLICGFILASPIVFYQFWAFVGAGLYPHEKAYVYKFLPASVGLFLTGVFLCFIWVLPGAVKALLAFNEWLGVDPDIRLNEWLSLAIILPLVFGISFQTPLAMLILCRIGMFTWEDYLAKWRYATFILAVFAAVITPTPDAVTMLYLFIPMFALYMLGILLCKWSPGTLGAPETEDAESDKAVAV
jgi:sec-independent protein translocase protein TatC